MLIFVSNLELIHPFKKMPKELEHITGFDHIIQLIERARNRAFASVNTELICLYFDVGRIVADKLETAKWGSATVDHLAEYISRKLLGIKGFNTRGLYRMKQFYESYSKFSGPYKKWLEQQAKENSANAENEFVSAVLTQISWTHHRLIISKTKSTDEKLFYITYASSERLSTRELERQLNTGLFERTLLANKNMSSLRTQNDMPVTNLFRDPYIFEFLDLPESHSESDLEKSLILNLKNFILEIGKGFSYMGNQYRLQVGNKDYYTDLLFYNRDLQCMVLFELKIEEFAPEFLGKLNFYLEALDRDVKRTHENPSIGVLLCKGKDSEVVEYAMARNISPAVIADYETKLIPREVLAGKLHELSVALKKYDE